MVSQISLYITNLAKSIVGLFNNSLLIPVACGKVKGIVSPHLLRAFFVSSPLKPKLI